MDEFMSKMAMAATKEEKNKIEQVYNLGVQAGIQQMMDKMERQFALGKPILANGNLYWLKDAKQNLIDIMDDIDSEYEAEKENYERRN